MSIIQPQPGLALRILRYPLTLLVLGFVLFTVLYGAVSPPARSPRGGLSGSASPSPVAMASSEYPNENASPQSSQRSMGGGASPRSLPCPFGVR